MKQNQTRNELNVTNKAKLGKKPVNCPACFTKTSSRNDTIHPGIFFEWAVWADSTLRSGTLSRHMSNLNQSE